MTRILRKSTKAFTMAEILLSLTIIGIVAAITLPSLTGNINERTWNTQRKALYARMSQAMALMPALNGMGNLQEGTSSTSAVDTAGQTFVTELGNVLKINNVCDDEHLTDCGFPATFNDIAGGVIENTPTKMSELNPQLTSMHRDGWEGVAAADYTQLDTKAVAFETQNGESVIAYYNPSCKDTAPNIESASHIAMQPYICVNFIYDLNGQKGPNTVGKDIGVITVLNASDSTVVAPVPYNRVVTASDTNATSVCNTELGSTEYRLPNYLEATSIWANSLLFNYGEENIFTQTQKMKTDGVHRRVITPEGELMSADRNSEHSSLCIKR